MKPWMIAAAVGCVAVAGVVATLMLWPSRDASTVYVTDLARGETIYAQECAACHGANLEGQANWRERKANGRLPAPPHDETGHTFHHPDRVLLDITRHGTAALVGNGYQSDMMGFGDRYTDAELRDVLAWIKSQWPQVVRQQQAAITAQDEAQR